VTVLGLDTSDATGWHLVNQLLPNENKEKIIVPSKENFPKLIFYQKLN
jgi:hypothetical protein